MIAYEEIAATPLGHVLGAVDGETLARRLERRSVPAGGVLFRQGDPGDHLYLVLSGRLRAQIEGQGGTTQPLGEIGHGELVGETALLRGGPRSATVEAVEPSVLAVLDAAAWRELRAGLPALETLVRHSAEWREGASEARRFRPEAAWVASWARCA